MNNLDVEKIVHQLIAGCTVSRRFKQHLLAFLLEAYGIERSLLKPDLEVFVNAQANTYQKEPNNICGSVQLSPVRTQGHRTKKTVTRVPDCRALNFSQSKVLYDSGAFTDVLTNSRVTPSVALERQLTTLSKLPAFQEVLLASYDLLIDEKHVGGTRRKERWSVEEGKQAVAATIEAARYLNSRRSSLSKFKLVQGCQGVDAKQYLACTAQVLQYCTPVDCIGLGGWCILGKQKHWLPVFFEVVEKVIPLIAEAGIRHVHIFGCTWYKPVQGYTPPLPILLHQCDSCGIKLTTDGRSPIGNALWKNWRRGGATWPYWRHNLAWVKAEMATLRDSPYYQSVHCQPRQLFLFGSGMEVAG